MGKSDQSIGRSDELINRMTCFDTFVRYCFLLVLNFAALLVPTGAAAATISFPARPIRFIVPYAPGGGADTLALALRAEERPGYDVA